MMITAYLTKMADMPTKKSKNIIVKRIKNMFHE